VIDNECNRSPELDVMFRTHRARNIDINYRPLALKTEDWMTEIRARIDRNQPVVVHRMAVNEEHVVVIAGIEDGELVICDPEGDTKKGYFGSGLIVHQQPGDTRIYSVKEIFVHE
jgi:hypothetical protein